ncbi:MAG: TRAP transporter small permease subunit [Oscillospiraceae bacterium]|nr:TRAP transporter small permease subunit [Oscillospiraceae bacterium]
MKKLFQKTIWRFDSLLLNISSVFLFIATLLSVINALGRFVGLGGFPWSDEGCVILLIFMVFLTQPFLEGHENQLCIGILENAIKTDKGRRILQIVRGILIIVILGFLAYECWPVVARAFKYNYLTSVLRIPRFILYACIFVSFVLMVINWIITVIFGNKEDKAAPEAKEEQA